MTFERSVSLMTNMMKVSLIVSVSTGKTIKRESTIKGSRY